MDMMLTCVVNQSIVYGVGADPQGLVFGRNVSGTFSSLATVPMPVRGIYELLAASEDTLLARICLSVAHHSLHIQHQLIAVLGMFRQQVESLAFRA
jgi:hypothetical protein